MNSFIFKVFIASVLLVLSVFTFFVGNEWNRAAFGSRGFIEVGSKFQMSIGEEKQNTIKRLIDREFVNISTLGLNDSHHNPQFCHGHTFSKDHDVQLWSDRSWRRGIICLAFKNEKLVRMSWHYGMFQP